jgi:NTP pyrophosphatase (non-canonical NTP hydrolase)
VIILKEISDIMMDKFQYLVLELLLRNKSILDSSTKFQDSCARVNRAIAKAVTHCGCVQINAEKQNYSENDDIKVIRDSIKTHIDGTLCESCRDTMEKEIGKTMFYLASICNSLDLNLYDILLKEYDRLNIMGRYNLK